MQINVSLTLTLPQDGEKLAILAQMAGCKLAPTAPFTGPFVDPETVAKVEESEKRTRVRKAKPEITPVAEAAIAKHEKVAELAQMSEPESTERLKTVGEAFTQRFSKQMDAVTEVKALIESKFKVARLRDLVHAQRVELIAILDGRIKEIDSKAVTAAPAASVAGL